MGSGPRRSTRAWDRAGSSGHRSDPASPPDPSSPRAAEDAALRILAAAAQSAAGLRGRLERRGFTEEAVSAAVVALVRHGYLDDGALANSIAARRLRTGHGRIRVAADLRSRGVADEAIVATLSALEPDAERANALALGRRLTDRARPEAEPRRERQRIGAALQRRGFDGETVAWVLRQLERGD